MSKAIISKKKNPKQNVSKKDISKQPLSDNGFVTLQNIFYILLVSVCVSAIFVNLFGIKTVSNIFQLYIIVLALTIALIYHFLIKKKLSLDILEDKSIIFFLAFVLFVSFLILFLKFTSMSLNSTEGFIFGLVFLLLVFAFVNIIFFIIGMG